MKSALLKKVQRFRLQSQTSSWEVYLDILKTVISTNRVKSDELTSIYQEIVSGNISKALDSLELLCGEKYTTPAEHFAVAQFASLVKKYPFQNVPELNPEQAAREAFFSSEAKCSEMNDRFRSNGRFLGIEFSEMRAFIRYVLGDEPSLNEIYNESAFGPGASVGVHGNATHLAKKYLAKWTVTPAAYYYARSALKHDDHVFELLARGIHHPTFFCLDSSLFDQEFSKKTSMVSYNKIAFVPKTAKTFRSIAIEPSLNSYLQKGVDLSMRKRLLRIGIDLSDQELNSHYAYLGSICDNEDSFVTIDLKSASDSISIGLAEELLPYEWFRFLDSIRSKNFLMDKEIIPYHKFCSMGNGFCFPLETLLFTAACSCITKGRPGNDFLVYGDDIIVRKKFAEPLIALLGEMGFSVNTNKTFISGPFRESCGRDWFGGEDVRPFVLDFALDSIESYFKFLNLTRRNTRSTVYFAEVHSKIMLRLPESLRFLRPHKGNADSAIDSTLDEFMSSRHARWNTSLQAWSWYELLHSAVPDRDWKNDVRQDIVLTMAALRGSSSAKPFTFRRKTKTSVRRVSHACYS